MKITFNKYYYLMLLSDQGTTGTIIKMSESYGPSSGQDIPPCRLCGLVKGQVNRRVNKLTKADMILKVTGTAACFIYNCISIYTSISVFTIA